MHEALSDGRSRLPPLLALLRPRQWYKNILILVPLVFSGNLATVEVWPRVAATLLAFCALSGAVYSVNDVVDAGRDRAHPRKRHRPVASGAIRPAAALAFAFVLVVAGLALLAWVNPLTFVMGAFYLVLQAIYNGALKRILLWDAIGVAFGFVLRALAGTTALERGPPTEWLIVCTFLLALYLALAKRRAELLQLDALDAAEAALGHPMPAPHSGASAAATHRPVLSQYRPGFTEQAMQTSATLLLASYSLYTFFGTSSWMMLTLPFAFYGVFRHTWLVAEGAVADEAEAMWKDRAIQVNTALWLLTIVAVQGGLPQRFFGWVGGLA